MFTGACVTRSGFCDALFTNRSERGTTRARTRHRSPRRLEEHHPVPPKGGWGVSGWGRAAAAGRLLVPFDLVEKAQGSTSRPGLRGLAEVGLLELSQRELDAEVREVQVLLVDDRRDPRVDLDHGVADELDVEEVVELELADDRRG